MEEEIKNCRVCGQELTEGTRSKVKKGLCIDCEGKGADLNDSTQRSVNDGEAIDGEDL